MKRPVCTYNALKRRLVSLTLALWLGVCGILTWCVASDAVIQLDDQLREYIRTSGGRESSSDLPGAMEHSLINGLGWIYYWLQPDPLLPFLSGSPLTDGISSDDWLWGKWELYYGYEASVAYYDGQGNTLADTGDYLTFTYTGEENWENGNTDPVGYSYIDLEAIPNGSETFAGVLGDYPIGSFGISLFMPVIRLTGYFEENQFHPATIESADHYLFSGPVFDPEKICQIDSGGNIRWEPRLTVPVPEGQELVTIYGWEIGGYYRDEKPVRSGGREFESLTALVHEGVSSDELYTLDKWSPFETIVTSHSGRTDSYGSYQIAAAVRIRPLLYAAVRLVWVYLVSFAAAALFLWRTLRTLRWNLTDSLTDLTRAALNGHTISPSSRWYEPTVLEQHYASTHQTLAENKAEIQQLRTALDYAHDAEEKRKALISNITHELKTPLAIIRSYIECRQEDVLPEKREQYYAVIQEETDRMDSLILQMLELSRLESGRVRIASDTFSLLELTRDMAETMQPLMGERRIRLSYGLAQDFRITADEGRIAQVVSNYLSNAVKYSSEGGRIQISIFLTGGNAYFQIENTAPHLSEEALEKVWDSFYRGDASRNTPGTGLGLPLVKSIISLHGGTVSVSNTVTDDGQTGVRFGFMLPLK